MDYSKLEKDIENFVTGVFESPEHIAFPYHNLEHTRNVVAHATEIAKYYSLGEKDLFIIKTAAWFHDIGHLYGNMHGHEETGVLIMEDYLHQTEAAEDLIRKVGNCIIATRYPWKPQSLLEKIICDADTFHFGTPYFKETDDKVKKEMQMRLQVSVKEWHKGSLKLLKQHHYFTEYCQRLLEPGKQANIEWLQQY